MPSLLQSLKARWDLFRGRYTAFWVSSPEDRDACTTVIEQERADELGAHKASYDDVPLPSPGERLTDRLLACRDRARMVGAVRMTRCDDIDRDSAEAFPFDLRRLGRLFQDAYVAHRMSLLAEYRGQGVALVMMQEVYAEALRLKVGFCFTDCRPQLLQLYTRLGFRPVGLPATESGQVRIPIALVIHDGEHLRRVRSPLFAQWKAAGAPAHQAADAWWATFVAVDRPPLLSFTEVNDHDLAECPLLEGLSQKGRTAFLRNANRIPLGPSQQLWKAGMPGHWMALIEAGSLEVAHRKGRADVRLPGDLVGAQELLLGRERQAEVRAGPEGATVIVLSPSATKRLRDPKDQASLWRNLAILLARRSPREPAAVALAVARPAEALA